MSIHLNTGHIKSKNVKYQTTLELFGKYEKFTYRKQKKK